MTDDDRFYERPDRIDIRSEQPADLRAALVLMAERQRLILTRLAKIEAKQSNYDKLLNKGFGALAVVTGFGIFAGWLMAIGGNILSLFRRG